MTTIADELLNDFEDSGSEQEEERNDGLFGETTTTEAPATGVTMPTEAKQPTSMELDGDEEEPDEDLDGNVPSHLKMEEAEDEAETKARVEKMQLQNVGDVRSVAGLMKQLDPVLGVSPTIYPLQRIRRHLHVNTALT